MKALAGVLGFLVLLGASSAAQGAGQNILLLILDDVGTDLVSAYAEGDDPAPTPNIDSLAEGGVLFRNTYSAPVCSPTRATILTGHYGFANGLGRVDRFNNSLIREDIPNLPELLPEEYRKAALGKWHLGGTIEGPDIRHPVDFAGFEFYSGQPENFARPHRDNNYYSWTKFTAVEGEEGYETEKFWCSWRTHGQCYITSVMIDDVIDRIDAYGSEPWFLWVGFNAIHAPVDPEPPRRLLRNRYDYTLESEKLKAHLEAADREIGRLLRAIRRTDTLVIVVGDNGTYNGCKNSGRECGVRVPLIIKGPGMPAGRRESNAFVNTTDLFETIIEVATGEAVSGAADSPDSESLVPYLEDPTRPTAHRESVDGPYVYTEKFERIFPVDERRALRGDRAALEALGVGDWDQNYKLAYERVGEDPSEHHLVEKLYGLGNDPVPRESPDLLYDGDGDTTPDTPLSFGAQAALADLRETLGLLQDRDGDGVDYRIDNCVAVAQATDLDCGYEGAPHPCFCDTDGDGIGNMCDCDFDNDGVCGDADFAILGASWGLTGPSAADMDCDLVVEARDQAIFEERLGARSTPGPSGLWCANALGATAPCATPGS